MPVVSVYGVSVGCVDGVETSAMLVYKCRGEYWNAVQWMIVPMCSQRCIYNKYARKKAKRQKAMPQRCKKCICKVRWYSAPEERAGVVPHCGGRGGDDFRCLISNALPHPCLALHWGGGWRNCFLFCWVGIGATFNCTVLKTRSFLKHTLYMCSQSWWHI